MIRFWLILSVLLLANGNDASADLIFQPDTVTASTEVGAVWAGSLAGDQSGLSQAYTSGVDNFATVMGNRTHQTSDLVNGVGWASNISPTLNNDPNGAGAEFLQIDLGQQIAIERLGVWMQLQGSGPGTNFSTTDEFEVFSSTDNSFTTLTSLGIFNVPLAPNGAGLIYDITDTTTQFVLLNVRSLHPVANQHASFGEVAFEGSLSATAVPEPSTATLMLPALLAGLVRRRRQLGLPTNS